MSQITKRTCKECGGDCGSNGHSVLFYFDNGERKKVILCLTCAPIEEDTFLLTFHKSTSGCYNCCKVGSWTINAILTSDNCNVMVMVCSTKCWTPILKKFKEIEEVNLKQENLSSWKLFT